MAAPTGLFIFMGQTNTLKKQALTVLLVLISILAMFLKTDKLSDRLKQFVSAYKNGLMALALFFLVFSFFPIGGYLNMPLLLEHSSEDAQAIFVLASGATLSGDPTLSGLQRVNHGIRLLREGRAPHLFLSSGYSDEIGHAEADWLENYATLFALSPASYSVLKSKEIVTTATEAAYAKKVLAAKGINNILVVTNGGHILRTCLTFTKAGFAVKPAPVHNQNSIPYHREAYISALHGAVHEWLGLIYYRLKGYI